MTKRNICHTVQCVPKTIDAIGDNVKQYRERRNWTVDQLADRAGIAPRTIARIEAGHDAQVSTLIAVAEALGTTLDSLRATD